MEADDTNTPILIGLIAIPIVSLFIGLCLLICLADYQRGCAARRCSLLIRRPKNSWIFRRSSDENTTSNESSRRNTETDSFRGHSSDDAQPMRIDEAV